MPHQPQNTVGSGASPLVFVSYSRTPESHRRQVEDLVDQLRLEGYGVKLDTDEVEHALASDFRQLMHQGITHSDRVLVVASEDYKKKSENFESGVGKEFRLILRDIDHKPNKYAVVVLGNPNFDQLRNWVPLRLQDHSNSVFYPEQRQALLAWIRGEKRIENARPIRELTTARALYLHRRSEGSRKIRLVESNLLLPLDEIFVVPQLLAQEVVGAPSEHHPRELLDERQNALISGAVGTGKTALLHHLVICELESEAPRVPVFLRLNRLSSNDDQPVIRAMKEAMTQMGWPIPAFELERMCERGEILLLTDALDEVPDSAFAHTIDVLNRFALTYSGSQVLVTSRRLQHADHLTHAFARYSLSHLSDGQIETFVAQWCQHREGVDEKELLRAVVRTDSLGTKALLGTTPEDYAGRIVNSLVELQIFNENLFGPSVAELNRRSLARTPLALTLLCVALEREPRELESSSRSELLGRLVSRLVRASAQRLRETDAHLSVSDLLAASEAIAATVHREARPVLTQRQIQVPIRRALEHPDLRVTAEQIEQVRRALVDSGLVQRDLDGHHYLAHQSVEEYLTARHFTSCRDELEQAIAECYLPASRSILVHCAALDHDDGFFSLFEERLSGSTFGDRHLQELLSWAESQAASSPVLLRPGATLCYVALVLARLHAPTPLYAALRTIEDWFPAHGFDSRRDGPYNLTPIGAARLEYLAKQLNLNELESTASQWTEPEVLSATPDPAEWPAASVNSIASWLLAVELYWYTARHFSTNPDRWTARLPHPSDGRSDSTDLRSVLTAEDYRMMSKVSRDTEEQYELLTEAIRRAPSVAEHHLDRGWVSFNNGNWARARPDFERACQLATGKRSIECATSLAGTLFNLDDYSGASDILDALEKSPEANPEQLNDDQRRFLGAAYFKRGQCRVHLGKYEDALADFETAESHGLDVEASWVGCAHMLLGHTEEAIRLYEKAIEDLPRFGVGHYNLYTLYRTRDHERAREHLARAEEILPDHPQILGARAVEHLRDEEYEPALTAFANLAENTPDRVGNFILAGFAALQLDRPEQALRLLDKAIESDANAPGARIGRSVALARLGRADEAEADQEAALAACPDVPSKGLIMLRLHHLRRDRTAFYNQLRENLEHAGGVEAIEQRVFSSYEREDEFLRLMAEAKGA